MLIDKFFGIDQSPYQIIPQNPAFAQLLIVFFDDLQLLFSDWTGQYGEIYIIYLLVEFESAFFAEMVFVELARIVVNPT